MYPVYYVTYVTGLYHHLAPCTRRGFRPKKCETNPIPAPPDLWKTKNAKRTQFSVPLASRRLFRTPITRNEPNFACPTPRQPPKNAKRTQSHKANSPKTPNKPNSSPPHDQKCKTNPISSRGMPQIRETNPIYTRPKSETNPISAYPASRHPKNAKRTQFTQANSQSPKANSQKMQNEPNFSIPSVPPPPISAKRTQFRPPTTRPTTQKYETNPISARPTAKSKQPTAKKCETNPISAYPASHHPLFWRNEPNLRLPQPRQGPKNAKRTQFPTQAGNLPYGHGMPCPKYTKQTQS